jgi:serine/threonine-protein kinase RsbW
MIVGNKSHQMIKNFSASLDKLYDMLHFVKEQASIAGFDSPSITKIELAMEEALVNIISYGYPELSGNIDISCSLPDDKNAGIKIIIRDKGIPYNPLTNAKKFDPEDSSLSKTIGGYGVFFILKIMDEVTYTRENNSNILTLTKYYDK